MEAVPLPFAVHRFEQQMASRHAFEQLAAGRHSGNRLAQVIAQAVQHGNAGHEVDRFVRPGSQHFFQVGRERPGGPCPHIGRRPAPHDSGGSESERSCPTFGAGVQARNCCWCQPALTHLVKEVSGFIGVEAQRRSVDLEQLAVRPQAGQRQWRL